jgi:transposase InsO family protein
LGKLGRLGLEQPLRYERSRPGELVHIAVEDYSRLAYAEVLSDERALTAAGFLRRATTFFARYGVVVEQILTDNGSCYRGAIHALTCRRLGIEHRRTRPYRPQTGHPNQPARVLHLAQAV